VPIYLRIIKDRKAKFISLGVSILPKYWNEKDKVVRKSHPNSVYLNNFLAKKISDAQSVSLEMETNSKYVTPKASSRPSPAKQPSNLSLMLNAITANIEKKGRIGSHNRAKAVVSKLKEFIGKRISPLMTSTSTSSKSTKITCVMNSRTPKHHHTDMKVIRRIINEAINDDLFPLEKNPFPQIQTQVAEYRKSLPDRK
jgi:integrase/recombinase XerD